MLGGHFSQQLQVLQIHRAVEIGKLRLFGIHVVQDFFHTVCVIEGFGSFDHRLAGVELFCSWLVGKQVAFLEWLVLDRGVLKGEFTFEISGFWVPWNEFHKHEATLSALYSIFILAEVGGKRRLHSSDYKLCFVLQSWVAVCMHLL